VSARAFWAEVLRQSVYGPPAPVQLVDLPRLYRVDPLQAHQMTLGEALDQFGVPYLARRPRVYTRRELWAFRFNEFMIAAGWALHDTRVAARDHAGELLVAVALGLFAGVGVVASTYCASTACW
jgi:hypothetical protein